MSEHRMPQQPTHRKGIEGVGDVIGIVVRLLPQIALVAVVLVLVVSVVTGTIPDFPALLTMIWCNTPFM